VADQLHVVISGRVQGVGFRYAAAHQARSLGLTGWIRNLPDGRVEAEFEGPRGQLDRMHAWCQEGPSFAHVTHVDTTWQTGAARHTSFAIR
jgi:acylphosphatase